MTRSPLFSATTLVIPYPYNLDTLFPEYLIKGIYFPNLTAKIQNACDIPKDLWHYFPSSIIFTNLPS